jgi:hypothetical protein
MVFINNTKEKGKAKFGTYIKKSDVFESALKGCSISILDCGEAVYRFPTKMGASTISKRILWLSDMSAWNNVS